jgi:hypothetical protein
MQKFEKGLYIGVVVGATIGSIFTSIIWKFVI